uniref:Pectinesterase inhibitor domain-containing protein n=1 Tax=Solanum lycopersicum TaxID=4081 RepID=A0A3Q7ENI1_SOLLC
MATPSSFSIGSTLVLCIIFASLIALTTSNSLADLCIKCQSPRFCLQVFGLNPHRNPYQLTVEAIHLTFTNASDTTNKIHTFLDQTNDDNLKEIYNYCLNYYEASIDILSDAEEHLLRQGIYDTLSNIGAFVQEVGFSCEDRFQEIVDDSYVSTLTQNNNNMKNFGSIIIAAGNLLSNSTSTNNN